MSYLPCFSHSMLHSWNIEHNGIGYSACRNCKHEHPFLLTGNKIHCIFSEIIERKLTNGVVSETSFNHRLSRQYYPGAANRKDYLAHLVAAGYLSHCLSGPLLCDCPHITVKACVCVCVCVCVKSRFWNVHLSLLYRGRMEGNVLFHNALDTFYLRLYGVRHMVNNHSHSNRGNPLPPLHGTLFPISSKGSFICIIPKTG